MMANRILQIIPATGWEAIYNDDTGDERVLLSSPLVCWALVELPDGTQAVQGIHAADGVSFTGVTFCEDMANFRCYQPTTPPEGLGLADLLEEP